MWFLSDRVCSRSVIYAMRFNNGSMHSAQWLFGKYIKKSLQEDEKNQEAREGSQRRQRGRTNLPIIISKLLVFFRWRRMRLISHRSIFCMLSARDFECDRTSNVLGVTVYVQSDYVLMSVGGSFIYIPYWPL